MSPESRWGIFNDLQGDYWTTDNNRLDELVASARSNLFAVVVMAQRTHGRGTDRLASKTQVARLLFDYGYSRDRIDQLLRLVDWMMKLPQALEALFIEAVDKIRQEKKMAFVTSFERVAKQKGLEKGLKQGELKGLRAGKIEGESGLLLRQLARKFGPVPKAIRQRIQTATSAQLETWSLNILDARTLDEVFLNGHHG